MSDRIETSGYPLAFRVQDGARPDLLGSGNGKSVYTTEARMFGGHQKEAIVTEGEGGPKWRLTSDEGIHLNGTDLAPFPLGFFNAGMHGELLSRIASRASAANIPMADVKLSLRNFYWMTGSFIKGDGEGFADSPEVRLLAPVEHVENLRSIVNAAKTASPAFHAVETPLQNTFALYVNGRRKPVVGMNPYEGDDVADPYVTYSNPPAPDGSTREDPIRKTGVVEDGEIKPAPAATKTKIIRTVAGLSGFSEDMQSVDTDTWLEMPGVSHFALRTDDQSDGDKAPTSLALISAAIAFCYMTQLSRYIENMKLNISDIRLVQRSPYQVVDGVGQASPVETHLFLHGHADVDTHAKLLNIAAKTCYLHATLAALLPINIQIESAA